MKHTTRRCRRTTARAGDSTVRRRNGEKITAALPLLLCWGVLFAGLFFTGVLFASVPGAKAQPAPAFGSADDPREPGRRAPWQAERYVGLWGGPSLVGPQWRAQLTGEAAYYGPRYAARLVGSLRGGVYGAYDEDTDDAYDLVRLVDFARYERTGEALSLYGRAGPIQQMTLGPAGHLVDFFRSNTAYDERTVGLEAFARAGRFSLGAFTSDVRLGGVTGGRLTARPFAGAAFAAARPALASAQVGLTAVTDLGLLGADGDQGTQAPTAFALDARYDALGRGGVALSPFASVATLPDYGWGAGAGAALAADNFANLGRFGLRLGLFYSGDQFTPGAFGPLYVVNNPRARIARSDAAFEDAPGERSSPATALADVESSAGWLLGLRLLFFERFELTSSYYGHLADQDLSRYHLRLFFQTQAGTRLYARLDRTGLPGVLSLFDAADDQTAVTFNADYRLPFTLGPSGVWAHLRTRYTFERIADGPGGVERFLPERRFEPSVGVRLEF